MRFVLRGMQEVCRVLLLVMLLHVFVSLPEGFAVSDSLLPLNIEAFGNCEIEGDVKAHALIHYPRVYNEVFSAIGKSSGEVEEFFKRGDIQIIDSGKNGDRFQKALLGCAVRCLPWCLSSDSCYCVLWSLYPDAVLGTFGWPDCMLISCLTPVNLPQLSVNTRKHWLGCLAGSQRAMMIKRVNNFSLDTVGRVYVKLYGQISRVSRDGKKTLDSNVSIVRKKISQSLSDNDLYGLSMSIPIKLSFSDCAELIKRLSLDNIFHPFIREERVLALHLAPCRLWSFLSPECTAAERMIFTRCLVAAIRSQALEDCGELAFAFLGKYLGLSRVGPVEGLTVKGEDKTLENDKIANCKKVLAGRLREEYEKASVTVDPEMIGCSSPDWSKTPTGVYEALKTAFEGRDGDGVLSLDTDLAVALIRHLFPEGTFHMYTGAEYVLMNSLSPVGRKLTDGEEFFWMECLMGAQRSFHINGNIAHPLRYFDWKKYLPEGFNDDGKNLADKKLK